MENLHNFGLENTVNKYFKNIFKESKLSSLFEESSIQYYINMIYWNIYPIVEKLLKEAGIDESHDIHHADAVVNNLIEALKDENSIEDIGKLNW